MIEHINELIDKNLNLIFLSPNKSLLISSFKDEKNREYDINRGINFAEEMVSRGLIKRFEERCDLTELGLSISENGGWLKYKNSLEIKNKEIEEQKKNKEHLELELALSNIEANKLNKEIAEKNRKNEKYNLISTWINIFIGLLNIGLLIWQLSK